jgi:hypothetical protein
MTTPTFSDAIAATCRHHDEAAQELKESRDAMLSFLEKHDGTDLGALAVRLLTWPEMHLYTMFNTAFNVADKANFHSSLYSFLVNVFLDDSYFVVRWELPYDDNFELKFDGNNNLIYFPSSREDERSRPHVYWTGDGSCSPVELMEVMDEFERREVVRALSFEQ